MRPFARIFKTGTGLPPHQYVLRKRIARLETELDLPVHLNGIDEIDTEEQPIERALGDILAPRAREAAEDEGGLQGTCAPGAAARDGG